MTECIYQNDKGQRTWAILENSAFAKCSLCWLGEPLYKGPSPCSHLQKKASNNGNNNQTKRNKQTNKTPRTWDVDDFSCIYFWFSGISCWEIENFLPNLVEEGKSLWYCVIVVVDTVCFVLPWYNHNGWLGVKKHKLLTVCFAWLVDWSFAK